MFGGGGGPIDHIVVTARPYSPSTTFYNYFPTPNYHHTPQYVAPYTSSGFGSSPINLPEKKEEEKEEEKEVEEVIVFGSSKPYDLFGKDHSSIISVLTDAEINKLAGFYTGNGDPRSAYYYAQYLKELAEQRLLEQQREELVKQFDATEDGTLDRHKSATNIFDYFDFSVKDVNKNGIPDFTYKHPDGNTYLLDANLSGINRSMIDIIGKIAEAADAFPNLTRMITGGIESASGRVSNTRHKEGDAMDIGVDGLSAREKQEFALSIREKIDDSLYDVEVESNHIHVEYHPDSEKGLDGSSPDIL